MIKSENVEQTQFKSPLEIAMDEAEKAKPSPEPSYWAKRSCSHCYGRGIEGIVTYFYDGNNKIRTQKLCSCAQARFSRWKKNWVDKYLLDQKITVEGPLTILSPRTDSI